MSVAIGFGVPVANVFAVGALSRGSGLGLLGMVRQILTNPFFLASVLGISFGVSGLVMPEVLQIGLNYLAGAAIPIALMAVGAKMDWGGCLGDIDAWAATGLVVTPIWP